MNRLHQAITIAAAIACVAAGNAFADDITIDPHPFVSTLTRAQVQEELREFQASGVNPWSALYDPIARMRPVNSRVQVVSDYLQSREMVAAFTSEDSGSSYLSALATVGVARDMELAQAD